MSNLLDDAWALFDENIQLILSKKPAEANALPPMHGDVLYIDKPYDEDAMAYVIARCTSKMRQVYVDVPKFAEPEAAVTLANAAFNTLRSIGKNAAVSIHIPEEWSSETFNRLAALTGNDEQGVAITSLSLEDSAREFERWKAVKKGYSPRLL